MISFAIQKVLSLLCPICLFLLYFYCLGRLSRSSVESYIWPEEQLILQASPETINELWQAGEEISSVTHLSQSTNTTESSISDIGQPPTLCLKFFVSENHRPISRRRDMGKIVHVCFPSLVYHDLLQWYILLSDPLQNHMMVDSTGPWCSVYQQDQLSTFSKSGQGSPSLSAAVTGLGLYETTNVFKIPKSSSESLCLTALSAVIHCCNTSVEARWGQRGIFYILLIKSQSFGEFVSWNCDFHKCFCRGLVSISWHPPPFQSSAMELWPLWLCVFLSLSETGRLQGIGRGGMLFPWGDKALAQSFP